MRGQKKALGKEFKTQNKVRSLSKHGKSNMKKTAIRNDNMRKKVKPRGGRDWNG